MHHDKFARTLAILDLDSEKKLYNPSEEKFSADEARLLELFADQKIVDEIIKMALAGELNAIKNREFFR